MNGPFDADLAPIGDLVVLEQRWRALEARSRGSFFLGWTWIGSWLTATGARPDLLSVRANGRDVALALVGCARHRRPLGRVPTLFLNQAGDRDADRLFIEYNGLLTAMDAPAGVEDAAMAELFRRPGWAALRLSGVEPGAPLLARGAFRRRVRTGVSPVWQVDLGAVRAAHGDYLSLLSANSRSQLRRSIKDQGEGDARITRAGADDLDPWLADMRRLNAGRHADNAWDHPGFRAFAAAMARAGLTDGSVELIRIEQGNGLLGYLFNFLHRGRAMNYQSAFAPPLTPRSKPGMMAHAAAVGDYAARGLDLYSLLAGKDRYKQSLSTCSETLEWWTLERFSLRQEGEHLLRRLLNRPASE